MVQAQNDFVLEIKNNKLYINIVSKENGITRQTFYNNPIITAYIEQYIVAKVSVNPYEIIDNLRTEIRSKDEMIAC